MSPAVGIDIGNNKCVIAISRNSVVDAVLNEESSRETPTVVHFAKDHRIFGGSGASNAATKPQSTISQLKCLVGRRSAEPGIADELQLLPFHTSWDAGGNILLVEVTYPDSKNVFTAVEMLVMLLSHIKRVTVGASSSDCVIGVPAYFTADQKTAYLNSARAAGWNPLGLLADGAAASILHGAQRIERESEARVVFVDVGHCDTQITVVNLQGQAQERTILAVASDQRLGGRDFDEIIVKHFASRFREQHGVDFADNQKAVARLRIACEKAKKVLSTNRDARINLDCFVGEMDLEGEITRTDFQAASSELVDKIGELFNLALAEANLTVDQVNFVELIGSGSRIPAISEKLSGIFGRALSRTMNGSECIACGCALLCEMLHKENSNSDQAKIETHEVVSRLGLTCNEFTSGLTASDDISSLLEKEEQWAKLDEAYHNASNQRNCLESYIYRKRNELSKKLKSSTIEREEISQALQEAEDWLCEKDNRDEDAYKTKLSKLKMVCEGNRNQGSDRESVEPGNILDHTANEKSKGHTLRDLMDEEDKSNETVPPNGATSSQATHRKRGNFNLPILRGWKKKKEIHHPSATQSTQSYTEGMGARVDPPTTKNEKKHKAENKTETAESAPTSQFKGVAADENQKMIMRDPRLPNSRPSTSVDSPTEHHTANNGDSPRATVDHNKTFKFGCLGF